MKLIQSKEAQPMRDWTEYFKAPPGKIAEVVRAQMYPREAQMKKLTREAYEKAPIGKEADAVWDVLKRYRNLDSSEVINIQRALPSKRVGDTIYNRFQATSRQREAAAERAELARRRRVLAALEKTPKGRAAVAGKGGAV